MFDLTGLLQTLVSGLANGALYAFAGLGFGVVFRSTAIVNIAQGELTMLGAVLSAVLCSAGLPIPLAVLAATAGTGLVGMGFYRAGVQPATHATMSQLIILTIGLSVFLRGAVTTLWGSDPLSVPPFSSGASLDLAGVFVLPQELWLIAALLAVGMASAVFFRCTRWGLALRAGAANPLGAAFVGIDHRRLGVVAFCAAGLLGGFGGAVWAPVAFAQVDIGTGIGLKGFAAAALGGLSHPLGPVLGAVVLGLLEALSAGYVSSAYRDAICYGVLLGVLVLRPQGLLGRDTSTVGHQTPPERLAVLVSATTAAAYRQRLLIGICLLAAWGWLAHGAWLTAGVFALLGAMVVMGQVVLTGFAGQLSLGQGLFMMIGAYTSALLTMRAGWPSLAALAVGAGLAALVAFIVGLVILRLRGFYLSIASLALLVIGLTFAREWVDITGGATGLPGVPSFMLLGWPVSGERAFYWLSAAAALLVLGASFSLTRSRFGRSLLALRSSEAAAASCGIGVVAVKARAFAFSAACAAVAGGLQAHFLGIVSPLSFGLDATAAQLTALTIGGFMSLTGAFVGSAVVVALPLLITAAAGSSATRLIAGLQLLAFGAILMTVIVVQARGGPRAWLSALRRRFCVDRLRGDAAQARHRPRASADSDARAGRGGAP